jgi:hypothetical protein
MSEVTVQFDHDFDYQDSLISIVAYKAGHTLSIPQPHADAAVAAGAARLISAPEETAHSADAVSG